jgi:hypothetical protein
VVRIATLSKVPAVKYCYEIRFIIIGMGVFIRYKCPHISEKFVWITSTYHQNRPRHNMKASVIITLVAQALFTTAAAAVVARVPVDEILIRRGDPPPYRPAHDK